MTGEKKTQWEAGRLMRALTRSLEQDGYLSALERERLEELLEQQAGSRERRS